MHLYLVWQMSDLVSMLFVDVAIFCNARFNLNPVAFIVAIQTGMSQMGTASGKEHGCQEFYSL